MPGAAGRSESFFQFFLVVNGFSDLNAVAFRPGNAEIQTDMHTFPRVNATVLSSFIIRQQHRRSQAPHSARGRWGSQHGALG